MESLSAQHEMPALSVSPCLSVLNHVAAGVYAVNEVGICTLINPAALHLMGYTEEECLGQDMHALWHARRPDGSAYPVEECPLYQARLTGEAVYGFKEVLWAKSGEPIQVMCSSVPLISDSGSQGTVITLHDLSLQVAAEQQVERSREEHENILRQRDASAKAEQDLARQHRESAVSVERAAAEQLREQRQVAEERLFKSEKLAAVGRLAASISHEINNPLEAVTNLLYLVRHDGSISSEADEYLRQAEQELSRVSEIVSQTLRFQRSSATPSICAPEALVDSVVALHQGRLHHSGIRIVRQHRRSGPFRCVEGDLRQVLNNLVSNAIDAMRTSGGTITIRTSIGCDCRSGDRGLRISVADTGHGMSKETAAQIFDPFYTTKGSDGSGLGLWISNTIAKRHGGRMQVRSRMTAGHCGTTFGMFVPESVVASAT